MPSSPKPTLSPPPGTTAAGWSFSRPLTRASPFGLTPEQQIVNLSQPPSSPRSHGRISGTAIPAATPMTGSQ